MVGPCHPVHHRGGGKCAVPIRLFLWDNDRNSRNGGGVGTMNQFAIQVGTKRKDAFEGWFVKVDDQASGLMFSVIWGYATQTEGRHAFLQFQDTRKNETTYVRYPMEELAWTADPFVLTIGKNTLSEAGMVLDFEREGLSVKGRFSFGAFAPIRRTAILKPNIMGWLSYFPNECNHAIISMHHSVSGTLSLGDATWTLRGADGYMEKDWGTGFPKAYVWCQANDWEGSALVFSYATVPVLGRHAKGFFLVLHHEGKEIRMSSIEGSRMKAFTVSEDAFSAVVEKGSLRVTLHARQAHPVALASPDQGAMKARIKESLDGTVALTVEKKGKRIVALSSSRASIDVHFPEAGKGGPGNGMDAAKRKPQEIHE